MSLICPECREVDLHCEHDKIYVSPKWRAPKKSNTKAWKRIAEGDLLWDKKAVAKKAGQRALHHWRWVLCGPVKQFCHRGHEITGRNRAQHHSRLNKIYRTPGALTCAACQYAKLFAMGELSEGRQANIAEIADQKYKELMT